MRYFAYGSNMNLDHMRRLCGWRFEVISPGVLENYEFGPDHRGYANIRPRQGSRVHGVLFELDQKSLEALDDFEGHPHVFGRVEVEIKDESQQAHKAWVYLENAEQFGGSYIKPEYLKRVIAGARENRLPQDWINRLESYL